MGKKIGIGVSVLVGVIVVAAGALWVVWERALAANGDLPDVTVMAIPTDAASLARGKHLARSVAGCADCHTSDLGGNPTWAESPGLLPSSNLTPGGVGADYTVEDWVRALRTGIAADGRRLLIMPSQASAAMTDEDMGALVAYLQSIPAVERDIPPRDGKILASIFVGASMMPTADKLAADVTPLDGEEGVDAKYGEYLATIGDCAGCHGPNLAGNPGPGGEPGVNITPGGRVDEWSAAEFLTFFRTGLRPDGSTTTGMPIENGYDGLTDDEVEALRLFLLGLPELADEGPKG